MSLYVIYSCIFDLLSRFSSFLFNENSSFSFKLFYRLGELLIIGYLLNNYWLKNRILWYLISIISLYILYDWFIYRDDVFNYSAYALVLSNVLLLILIIGNLIKQLNSDEIFSVTNQMLCLIFNLFSIHLIYMVFQNYIINQTFNSKSFTWFYSGYAILHILYYFALGMILYKNRPKILLVNHQ